MNGSIDTLEERDWQFLPGEEYKLKYRMVVYNGQTAAEAAECLWKQFADPSQGERSAGSGGLNACDWSSLSELQTALPKKGVFQDGRDHASE